MSDIVLMEGRGFGFVTYSDPQSAQQFLEVREVSCYCLNVRSALTGADDGEVCQHVTIRGGISSAYLQWSSLWDRRGESTRSMARRSRPRLRCRRMRAAAAASPARCLSAARYAIASRHLFHCDALECKGHILLATCGAFRKSSPQTFLGPMYRVI